MTFHHGITALETLTGTLPMRTVATGIIALIAHASDADDTVFPLGQPVLVTSIPAVLAAAGYDGTLRRSLETINPITRPTLVVVRIEAPTTGEGPELDVSGITAGIDSLLSCPSVLGLTPKILIAPELETPDVVQSMISYCQRRRAYCYVTPRDTAGLMLTTKEDVTAYRATLAAREVELIWPEFTGGNVLLSGPQPGVQHIYAVNSGSYTDLDMGEGEGIRVTVNGVTTDAYLQGGDQALVLTNALQLAGLTVDYTISGDIVDHWAISSSTPCSVTITGINSNAQPASNITLRSGLGSTPITYMADLMEPATFTLGTGSGATYGPGIIHSVTVAAALRAQIDQTTGWHKSLSNIAITGPTGISQPISWDLEDPDTDAGYLNSHDVTTLINQNGLRFWGNRNCSDDPRYAFEVYTRSAQTILQTIIDGCFPFIDQPLTPTLGRDILDSINAKLAEFVSQGRLIGAKARYDEAANTTQLLSQGQFWVVYDYTPVPTLENLGLNQRITDSYLIDFAQLIAQAG